MQLFKRMGYDVLACCIDRENSAADRPSPCRPRVILVEDHGALVGLVTVKDVLRFTAIGKPDKEPSWDERGGLDGMLEEVWTWAVRVLQRAIWWRQSGLGR
jgi:chloride channel 3/4/5